MILLISTLIINLAGCKVTLKAGIINNEDKIETNENEQVEIVKEKLDALCSKLIDADEENINKALKEFQENTLKDVENVYFAKEDSKKLYIYPNLGLPEDYDPTKRPWYEKAKEDEYYINEYIDSVKNNNMLTVSKALYKDKVFVGVVGLDLIIKK
ncbi:cache domain-containing protein [Crassaminicella indica]|uniref:Cache domain-containing protein n=1 Tax=Crassaminicella indica TaxID=2855394 RepID=A0ABX8RE31_9CLOT|nr:cache domain-containing protein [Crassaminicella indica]QXM07036.1 cache domain-containing protein [Crassaminicella indica]